MEEVLIYTVKEVAKLLHTSPNCIYRLIEYGYIPVIKIGSIKILKNSLEKFLIENEGNDFTNIKEVKKIDFNNIGEE